MEDNAPEIDVESEKTLFSDLIDRDMEALETTNVVDMDSVDLPKNIPYEFTQGFITSDAKPKYAEMIKDYSADVDSRLSALENDVKDMKLKESDGSGWSPAQPTQEKYEESPMFEQTNRIFIQRMDRFSSMPRWA